MLHRELWRGRFNQTISALQYDVYVHRRIVEIGSDELDRLLAAPSTDAMILTRRRWATAQTRTGVCRLARA